MYFDPPGSGPLISCIMPTRGRPEFAARALELWQAQTWPARELVIIDDADAPSFPHGCDAPGVRYYAGAAWHIGPKRNLAISRSIGPVICHWDDDDYSAPGRLADQIERLFESGAQVTGYHSMLFCEQTTGRRWRYAPPHDRYAIGSSLMYLRDFWRSHPFSDKLMGEDNDFVTAAVAAGVLCAVDAGELMWASIHPGNTSQREVRLKPFHEVLP